jgi:tetratricopeptide (TPR) repeat protein
MDSSTLSTDTSSITTKWLHYGLITFFILICYSNTFDNAFIYDDEIFIINNRFLREFQYFSKFFTESAGAGAYNSDNFYRPIQLLLYGIAYQLFELDVRAYHTINIVLHILNSLLIYSFVNNLFPKKKAGLLTAIIFAIHPIHTEAISYINGTAEPLFLLFSLLTIISFFKGKEHYFYYFLAVFFNIIALLSKETAIVLPLVIIAADLTIRKFRFKKIPLYLLFALINSSFVYIRLSVLNFNNSPVPFSNPYNISNIYTESLKVRLCTFLSSVTEYLKILVYPFDLKYDRVDVATLTSEPVEVRFAIVLLLTFILLAFKSLKGDRITFFCVTWPLIFLLPVSGIVPVNGIIKEHWLYAPSVGFLLGVVIFINSYLRWIRYLAFTIIICGLLYGTIERNKDWQSPEAFYNAILEHNPDIARVHNNLGKLYDEAGNTRYAEYHYKKAIELADYYPETRHNLGLLFFNEQRIKEGIEQLELALKIDPDFIYSHITLEEVYRKLGDTEKADFHRMRILQLTNTTKSNQ